jgi:ubiquinone/menaquinone biosynthesis C-methylase UbiE
LNPDLVSKPSTGKKVFAWFMRNGDSVNRKLYAAYKNDLFRNIHGTVLDIGAGTGLNLAYAPDNVTKWIAVEPNGAFHGDIALEAAKHPFPVEISSMDAHRLEIPDSSMEFVVCTLVLCSVDKPKVVLSEIQRVLKPGGSFVFIEHVKANSRILKLAQDMINPLNRIIADGCNCNRDTKSVIAFSGLHIETCESIQVKGITWFHRPHIIGLASKPRN